MTVKRTISIRFKNTFFIMLAALLVVFINCRGYRLLLPEGLHYIHMHIFRIFTLVSMAFTLCMALWLNNKDQFIFYFLIACMFLFLLPQFLYTYLVYGQGVKDYYITADHYLYVFWTVPLMYLFVKEKSLEKFLKWVVIIVSVGYVSLFINVLMKNTLGFAIFRISENGWSWRGGLVRILDCSSFVPLVVALIAGDVVAKGRISRKQIILTLILASVYLYVERTRMTYIAVAFMIYAMILFNRKNKLSRPLLVALTILGAVGIFGLGYIDKIINMFSVENNGNSTVYRLAELQFYLENFLKNPIFGTGLLSKDNLIEAFNIKYWADHNFEDIGIFGLLGLIGLPGVLIMFVVPVWRMILITVRVRHDRRISDSMYLTMVGLIAYILITCFLLIIDNYQRMALLPFVMVMFEYIYGIHMNKWRSSDAFDNNGLYQC